jgi:hypothetical protein
VVPGSSPGGPTKNEAVTKYRNCFLFLYPLKSLWTLKLLTAEQTKNPIQSITIFVFCSLFPAAKPAGYALTGIQISRIETVKLIILKFV